MRKLFLFAAASVFAASAAHAAAILVNFETVPVLATGPSTFGGPEQTITVPGVATFLGGTILGNATNFPAADFGTPPNTYASADFGGGGLSSTITINVLPAFGNVNEISFPLFNGETDTRSYVVTAKNGATTVDTINVTLASNANNGFSVIDLLAPTITSVTIAPLITTNWDFLIDSVAINENVVTVLSGTPEPGSFLMIGLGLAASAFGLARRKKA